jgi:hypothetical protein
VDQDRHFVRHVLVGVYLDQSVAGGGDDGANLTAGRGEIAGSNEVEVLIAVRIVRSEIANRGTTPGRILKR